MLFVAAIIMLFYQLPIYSQVTDSVHTQTNRRLNTAQVNTGYNMGLGITPETKEEEQYPYMSPVQIYFDLIAYDGTKSVLLGDSGRIYTADEIQQFKELSDDMSLTVSPIAQYLDNCSQNAKFRKEETADYIAYRRQ